MQVEGDIDTYEQDGFDDEEAHGDDDDAAQ